MLSRQYLLIKYPLPDFMRTPLILVSLLILISFKGSAQTYSTVIPDKEFHHFFYELNSSKVIRIHKLDPEIFSWELSMMNITDSASQPFSFPFLKKDSEVYATLNASFSPADCQFIQQQLRSIKDSVWNFSQLKGFVKADSAVYSKIFEWSASGKKRIGDYYLYKFSIPLFSLDRKAVMVYQHYYCGALCLTACLYLYKKDDKGVWHEVVSWQCLLS